MSHINLSQEDDKRSQPSHYLKHPKDCSSDTPFSNGEEFSFPNNFTSHSRSKVLPTILSSNAGIEGGLHTKVTSSSGCAAVQRNENKNKDQHQYHLTAKPPLPTTTLFTKPPNKMGSKNSGLFALAWASSTTPRMRVPMPLEANSLKGGAHSKLSSPPVIIRNRGGNRNTTTIPSQSDPPQFHYNGPHQVYSGPTATTLLPLVEGPDAIRWSPASSSSSSLLKPPPPPPEIFEDILEPSTCHQTQESQSPLGSLASQQEFLRNVLQGGPQHQMTPFESHQGSPLLTPPTFARGGVGGTSQCSSFPSISEMEQAAVIQRPHSVGPFVNNGIPTEIKDDLLRIELLLGLGLEKYKEAINQKIQNHNQLIQLVNTRSQLNFQQQQQKFYQPKFQQPPQEQRPQPLPPHHQQHQQTHPETQQWTSGMDIQHINDSVVDGITATTNLSEDKPAWSEEITEPFNSPNFVLNTFMEPNSILTTHPNPNNSLITSTTIDPNANEQKPISMLKTINFEEFQALAEQSRSGFPSAEVMQQNPLLAGAQQFQATSLNPFSQIHPGNFTSKLPDATKAIPFRIQVSPKESHCPSSPNHARQFELEQQQQQQQQQITFLQQQYHQYLQQDHNFHALSANSFKNVENHVGSIDNDLILQKPVTVGKGLSKSPSNLFPTQGLPIVTNDGAGTPIATYVGAGVGGGGSKVTGSVELDKPSPFFPGFSGSPIEIKIKHPHNLQHSNSQPLGNRISGNEHGRLEGVEELGNLLSQLPVLTRKQKVEEFQAFNILKPETPMTEAESETSMIPLVSSNGTLISDRRPGSSYLRRKMGAGSEGVGGVPGDTSDDELRNVNTNKMSINELVTLGRKIYRILSQLSTSAVSNVNVHSSAQQQQQQPEPQQQIYTAPVTLNVPSPNTPIFTTSSSKASLKKRGSGHTATGITSPTLVVDFNTIPNPTFITGPGVNVAKSSSKHVPSSKGRSQTPLPQHLPNTFRKILHPPPTRWDSKQQGATTSHNTSQEAKKIIKLATPSSTYQRVSSLPPASTPKLLPDRFAVREKYNNNYSGEKSVSRHKRCRQPTPYPFKGISGISMNPRESSLGRRNFIQENITKVKLMKKLPDSRVRPRKLPPVNKKKYENIPSTIPGSRSRSNSANRTGELNYYDHDYGGDASDKYRSSSVPASTQAVYNHYANNRSLSTPRPSTGMSVNVASSRSPSSTPVRAGSRPSSRGILRNTTNNNAHPIYPRPILGSALKGTKAKISKGESKVQFGMLPKASIGTRYSFVDGNGSPVARKSRSKTKRVSNTVKNGSSNNKNTSASSMEQETKQSKKKPQKNSQRKVKKHVMVLTENLSTDFTDDEKKNSKNNKQPSPIFNSESEQQMIRNMVKDEMNLMVKKRVKNALKKEQSKSKDKWKVRERVQAHDERVDDGADTEGEPHSHHHSPHDHDDSTLIESGEITPVYTPPKYYDESLFSLEKWINPDGASMPGSSHTSANETPVKTAKNNNDSVYGVVGRRVRKVNVSNKPQSVRFSLPNQQKKTKSK